MLLLSKILGMNGWSRWKQKLIAQFICKSWDESFKASYSTIEQYLSNKNENATALKSKNFLDLNKTLDKAYILF